MCVCVCVCVCVYKFNYGIGGSPGGSGSKESACNAGDPGLIPGSEDPLEKEMATHSSIFAWRSQWTKSLVGYSPWGHKESETTE